MLQTQTNKTMLSSSLWLIMIYRVPVALIMSLLALLLSPIEIGLRYLIILPFYINFSPEHKVKYRVKKYGRIKTLQDMNVLWLWVKDEAYFPWKF